MAKRIYKAKEPVSIRYQNLSDGNKSIYLDYNLNGKRIREFLRLYLIPEHDSNDKARNDETRRLATAIKSQRITDLITDSTGLKPIGKGKILLSDYLIQERTRYEKRGSKAYASSIRNTIKQVLKYGNRPLNKIDKAYLEGYATFLRTATNKYGKPLSANSQSLYFDVVSIALNTAVKENLLRENPAHRIDSKERPAPIQSKRVYLTLDELKRLEQTPAIKRKGSTIERYEATRQAFLFACYTGLRYSDIITLRWEDIKTLPDGSKEVVKTMQKTKEVVYLPLSAQALEYLPQRENEPKNGLVFTLSGADIIWDILQDWSKRAGIEKHISFHTSRHTFATLTLSYGADVYTIKELLGHKNINTTQIYAKVVADNKIKAVNLIPSIK